MASVIVAATAIMILISVKSDVATSINASTAPPPSADSLPAVVQSTMPSQTDETTARTNPPTRAVPPATDETDRVRTLQQQLKQSLDERWPMYAIGDTVALRRTDGLVHRGQLAGVRDGYTLLVDGVQRERVRLDALDGESRLRVDPDWRERRVAQRLQQLRNRE